MKPYLDTEDSFYSLKHEAKTKPKKDYAGIDAIIFTFTVISIVIGLSIYTAWQIAYGQSLDNFKTYTNNDLNFTIQHPSNWLVEEDEKSPHETVWFKLPDRHLPIFVVQIGKDKPYLDTDTMTLKNTTVQQHVQRMQKLLSSLDIGYNLIRQNEVTLGGNTGVKTEYSTGSHYNFEIVTDANGNFYTLTYQDYPLKVPETLPLANRMVDSFHAGVTK